MSLKQLIYRPVGWREAIMTFVGAFGGIGTCAFLFCVCHQPLLIAPYGASAVLIYCATSVPLAQPRNVIFGHIIASIVGITCFNVLGGDWYVMGLAVALAILAMMITGTVHPPAGATSLVCVMTKTSSYLFILKTIIPGVAILLTFAILSARIFPGVRPYPHPKKA